MDWTALFEDPLSSPTVRKLLVAAVALAAVFVVRRLINRGLTRRIGDKTTRYRARKMVGFASYLVAAVALSTVFASELGGLSVALGVAGAGIAFALQEVIASVAGWLGISFAGFYKVGDRVMLGGIKGDVIDIGVLRTTLFEIGDWVDGDLYNGRVVRLANSFVFKEPVFNYSAEFPFVWDELSVPVRHGSDRALAQQLLEEVAHEVTGEYAAQIESTWQALTRNFVIEPARVEPMVTMVFDENWMRYTVRYVVEHRQRRTTKHALFERIYARIDASEGRVGIASAAQEITLMRPSTVDVSLPSVQDRA